MRWFREPTHPLLRAALNAQHAAARVLLLRPWSAASAGRRRGRRHVSLSGWISRDAPSNAVTTAKYNVVTFLPRFLFQM